MKSELEKCNSWKPFLERMQSVIQRKDFSVSTIRSLFRFADPEFDREPIGVKEKLYYWLFWHTTEKGRRYRYLGPLQGFMKRKGALFQNAPKIVVFTYNSFLQSLLGPKEALPFVISEKLIRTHKTKEEILLEKGKKGKEILDSIANEFRMSSLPQDNKEESFSFNPMKVLVEKEPEQEVFIQEEKEEAFVVEDRFRKLPYNRFYDVLEQKDSTLKERMEERKRILEELLIRKRTLSYQMRQMQEKEPSFDAECIKQLLDSVQLEGAFFEKNVSLDESESRIATFSRILGTLESTLKQKWQMMFEGTVSQCSLLGAVCVKLAFQLWAFISRDVVWKDMNDRTNSLRETLLPVMHSLFEATSGELIESLFFQMVYLDDMKALSGELFSRASREKDFVESAEKLLNEALSLFILTHCSSDQENKKGLKELIERLLEVIRCCMTPAKSFPEMFFREEVSILFRDLWEKLEAVRSQVQVYKAHIFSTSTEEQIQEYIRRLFLFCSDVERAGFFPIGELYSSFQKEELKGLPFLIEWQRNVLQEKIGASAFLISLFPSDQRTQSLSFLFFFKKREESIKDFAKCCMAGVHSDAPFVQVLLWNMRVLIDSLFIQELLKPIFHEEQMEEALTQLLNQIERSFKLWWLTLPSSVLVSDKALISRITSHVVWEKEGAYENTFIHTRVLLKRLLQNGTYTYKGSLLEVLLYMYDLFDELQKKKSPFLLRASALLKMMLKELFTCEFLLSPLLLDVLQDLLHDIQMEMPAEELKESNLLFHILKKIEQTCGTIKSKDLSSITGHSLPRIGDASFFLKK